MEDYHIVYTRDFYGGYESVLAFPSKSEAIDYFSQKSIRGTWKGITSATGLLRNMENEEDVDMVLDAVNKCKERRRKLLAVAKEAMSTIQNT